MRSDPVESARFYLHGLASLFGRRLVAEADLVWVLRRSPPVDYAAGQVVFRQGELAESAILVVHGELGTRPPGMLAMMPQGMQIEYMPQEQSLAVPLPPTLT